MERNRRLALAAAFLALALAIAGCGPGISVTNKTNVKLSVSVFPPGGGKALVSPAPGQTVVVDVILPGEFTASAIPTKEWTDFATMKSMLLSALLANPDAMSATELAKLMAELASIDAKLKQFSSAGGGAVSCSAVISSDVLAGDSDIPLPIPMLLYGGGTVVASNIGDKLQLSCAATSN
jgi:hypothetical protein